MIPERFPLAEIAARLKAAIPEKTNRRKDFEKYAICPESLDSTWISGHQALRAIADYAKGRPMSETLTWIYTERSRALCCARAETREMPALQTHFDQIIYSPNIP